MLRTVLRSYYGKVRYEMLTFLWRVPYIYMHAYYITMCIFVQEVQQADSLTNSVPTNQTAQTNDAGMVTYVHT